MSSCLDKTGGLHLIGVKTKKNLQGAASHNCQLQPQYKPEHKCMRTLITIIAQQKRTRRKDEENMGDARNDTGLLDLNSNTHNTETAIH